GCTSAGLHPAFEEQRSLPPWSRLRRAGTDIPHFDGESKSNRPRLRPNSSSKSYLFQESQACRNLGFRRRRFILDEVPFNSSLFSGLEQGSQFNPSGAECDVIRSEEHTSELQSRFDLVCRLLLEKK